MLSYFLVGSAFSALVVWVVAYWTPRPFPDRLAKIPEMETHIDNVRPYDAHEKWARNGSQAGLHLMNPTRVTFFDKTIRERVQPPYQVLDVGCGGGLVSNALGTLDGYGSIHGVDLSEEALNYAKAEAKRDSLTHVSFQSASVYQLPFKNNSFNVVIVSDVFEHLLDLVGALKEVARVLKPNGILVFDTISRSPAAFVVAILGAEYVVRIVDKGTHDWRLFIQPEELHSALGLSGFYDFTHMAFDPSFRALWDLVLFSLGLRRAEAMQGSWRIEPPSSTMISYIGYAVKRAG